MAKDKPRGGKGVPNRHLHARTSFLYQAATYLTLQVGAETSSAKGQDTLVYNPSKEASISTHNPSLLGLHLGSHLRAVSLKAQVRLSSDVKRTICKTCNVLLIPGQTSTHILENASKKGGKPWADVLEVGCKICGTKKRYPVGAKRQPKKDERVQSSDKISQSKEPGDIDQSATSPMQTSTNQSPSSN
jgi:ribonuclease P protein subunit RPR2